MNHDTEKFSENSMIEMFNDAGEKISISHSEYVNKVLPRNLELHWDKPDELAAQIVNALHDGIYTNIVEEAAKHLIEIDTIFERSICLYGTLLLQTKRYSDAEELFLEHLKNHPRHPYVLTNLAKAQDFLHKPIDALKTLEESLTADPNQENALGFWYTIKKEAFEAQGLNPEMAILTILEEADNRFGGWRSKLNLGEYYANAQNKEIACKYYEAVLKDKWEPDALTLISGDLGKNGLIEEVIALVAPLYDPNKHDIMTGFNLLQAYLESKKITEGQQLLHALYNLDRPDLSERLSWYKLEFLQLDTSAQSFDEELISIDLEYIKYPLWCYGWNIKHGFDSLQNGKKIAILQFSFESAQQGAEISLEIENIEGRLARAIPLFLLENIYYGTNACPTVILPINKKTGSYILHGDPVPNQQIMELLEQGYEGVVSGVIESNQLKITYSNLLTKTHQHQIFQFDFDSLKETISQIEKFIFEKSEIPFDPNFKNNKKGFQYILERYIGDYLMLISQHLTLYRATKNNGTVDVNKLIRGLLKLAKDTQNIQIQLNLISVIHLCIKNNLSAIKTHADAIVGWLDNVVENANSLHGIAKKTTEVFKKYCDEKN